MIQIQTVTLDTKTEKQTIKLKGLQSVIGIQKVANNVMAIVVVNTSADLARSAPLYLIETGADAMSLLLKPKYIGSAGKYHLCVGELKPRR